MRLKSINDLKNPKMKAQAQKLTAPDSLGIPAVLKERKAKGSTPKGEMNKTEAEYARLLDARKASGEVLDWVNIELPMPPSLNRMYRVLGGRFLISKEGRDYRQDVAEVIEAMPNPVFLDKQRLSVFIRVHPPDKRRRDLDNLCKCLLDCLGNNLVYKDDSQIDRLTVERGSIKNPGLVQVSIEAVQAGGKS